MLIMSKHFTISAELCQHHHLFDTQTFEKRKRRTDETSSEHIDPNQ